MRRWIAWASLALLCASVASLGQSAANLNKGSKPTIKLEECQLKSAGGVCILSATQGVDFDPYLKKWRKITVRAWDKLIPAEVNQPRLKKGQVLIRFKILPNGRLMNGGMVLEGRSGDEALDRAAWSALTESNYPPLPEEFHGPYLELRALFMYNMKPSGDVALKPSEAVQK